MAARIVPVLLALVAAHGAALAQTDRVQHTPTAHTNERAIVETLRPSALAIEDPLAVFAFVLGNLPERAQVYPTENYYYFRFAHKCVRYAGNIRLAAVDRDQGKLHFAYGEQPTDWQPEPTIKQLVLGASQGVEVAKLDAFAYRVTHQGRAVTFVLNNLSQVQLPAGLLRQDEAFLGPIFDESAVRFFLVFNTRLKIFHYLLDETGAPPDQWVETGADSAVLLGGRTGFAFYRDGARKVLIGVHERNSRLNTDLDGPFDQLPENHIEGEQLREAIVASDPAVKGKIDRLGNFLDGSGRYLIHPYMLYRAIGDLAVFHRCMTAKHVVKAARALCFVIDNDEAQKRWPRPRALQRR